MSFFDKSVNGVVIALLEHFTPKTSAANVTELPVNYYKWILIVITGISSVLIFIGLLTIVKTRYGIKTPKMSKCNSMVSMH